MKYYLFFKRKINFYLYIYKWEVKYELFKTY